MLKQSVTSKSVRSKNSVRSRGSKGKRNHEKSSRNKKSSRSSKRKSRRNQEDTDLSDPSDYYSSDSISDFGNDTGDDKEETNADLLQNEGTGVILDTAENSLETTELETIPEENFGTISIPEDLPSEADDFLKSMAEYPLSKDENPYDVASYLRLAYKMSKVINPKKIQYNNFDFKAIQPCFGFLPIDSIKKTFECTTQLAKWHTKVPLQKHWPIVLYTACLNQ